MSDLVKKGMARVSYPGGHGVEGMVSLVREDDGSLVVIIESGGKETWSPFSSVETVEWEDSPDAEAGAAGSVEPTVWNTFLKISKGGRGEQRRR